MAPLRILLVFGSESGTAERGIATLAKQWTKSGDAAKFKIVGNVSGNSVTSLESLKERCDVLIISTSSFGEGDPPANYSNFLLKLYRAEKAGEMPLKGLQHAVLGYGCSVYPTFQNCPRMSDKLLGACGSRRFSKRVELDDGGEEDPSVGIKNFETSILGALNAGLPKPTATPACDWRVPADKIEPKTEDDLMMNLSDGDGAGSTTLVLAAVGLALATGAAWQLGMFG